MIKDYSIQYFYMTDEPMVTSFALVCSRGAGKVFEAVYLERDTISFFSVKVLRTLVSGTAV